MPIVDPLPIDLSYSTLVSPTIFGNSCLPIPNANPNISSKPSVSSVPSASVSFP